MNNNRPDFIFESSWEVCNMVGGIYTVLSTRAQTLQTYFEDQVIFIGPYFGSLPADFEASDDLYPIWTNHAINQEGLPIIIGRWKVPGKPIVILVDYTPFEKEKDQLYYQMWDKYRVDSSKAYGDYDDSCIFAYAVGKVIESFYKYHKLNDKQVVAHMNEWMLGMGALYLQQHVPEIATIFTTHATTIGRSIAGNNKELYAYMTQYNGDIMANELHVEAKHSIEKQTAHHVDAFTTVSDITAFECEELLDKKPTLVTPNGFEPNFVPSGAAYTKARKEARKCLIQVAEKLLGQSIGDDSFLIATSGRNEYRNKGLDVFIDSVNLLKGKVDKKVIAFIMVPGWVREARSDLKLAIDKNLPIEEPMQMPFITHCINQINEDKIVNYILQKGFTNSPDNHVNIIFVPSYLNGNDGIFNKSYYDLLIGMDATVFPSYYEPWGYTPLESIAFGIPTITTNLSGFGQWVNSVNENNLYEDAVEVVKRDDFNYFDVINNISEVLIDWSKKNKTEKNKMKRNCFKLVALAEWSKFIIHYLDVYDKALMHAKERNEKTKHILN